MTIGGIYETRKDAIRALADMCDEWHSGNWQLYCQSVTRCARGSRYENGDVCVGVAEVTISSDFPGQWEITWSDTYIDYSEMLHVFPNLHFIRPYQEGI